MTQVIHKIEIRTYISKNKKKCISREYRIKFKNALSLTSHLLKLQNIKTTARRGNI